MNMQVHNLLTSFLTIVNYNSKTFFQFLLMSYLTCNHKKLSQNCLMLLLSVFQHCQSIFLFRYDQNMHRSLGINVFKGKYLIIFIDYAGWNLFSDDFVKNGLLSCHYGKKLRYEILLQQEKVSRQLQLNSIFKHIEQVYRMKQPQMSNDLLEAQVYIKTRVMPILQPLQFDILQHRPTDIKNFAYMWLQSFKQNQKKHKETVQDDQEPDQVFKQRIQKRKNRKGFRAGVSGQSTSIINPIQERNSSVSNQITFQRTQQAKIKILIELKNSILFKTLNHSSLLKIISKMKTLQYKAGDIVLKEGEDGNQLFIVDQGSFRCHIQGKSHSQKVYGPGQAFGQLALLYNTKRASTITAQTDGKLFSLGRFQFNAVLRQNVLRRTQMCDRILNNIEIFKTLDRYERSKLYQSLQQMEVPAGKYVIRQGQLGDCFYIVVQGKLVAEKFQDQEIKPVYYYKQGDYFGEVAIIRNTARQASIKTLTKVRLLYIQRGAFKRLLGSIEAILKRNQEKYKKSKSKQK